MSGWRYHAMRILDRAWIHRDLPLREVSITPALSGPGAMSATLNPVAPGMREEDGLPILAEWRDLIIAEAADQVRWAGVLVNSTFEGSSWQLDIAGITAWPQGQPQVSTLIYGSEDDDYPGGPVPGVGADPIEICRDLLGQLQALPDAGVDLQYGGDQACAHRLARWYNVPNKWDYHPDSATTVEVVPYGSDNLDDLKTYDLVKVVASGTGFTKRLKPHQDKPPANAPARKPCFWLHHVYDYENTDLGAKINEYAAGAPFDYVETAEWADREKSDVRLRLDFGYPRIGARRDRLRFVEGENISQLLTVKRDGDDYANGVLAVGAGDGADQLRQTVTTRDGRLRRVKVITATDVTDKTRLKATATDALNQCRGLVDIEGFTVREHPHAPYGSYGVGDDVRVQVATGWAAGTALWVRITALTYSPDTDTVAVTCRRSDSFSYGSVRV